MDVSTKDAPFDSLAMSKKGQLAPDSRLGKYQILELLGTGGMAEIYLARAPGPAGFEKLVALKRILPEHALNDDFVRMFLKEARLAANLQHPNIVQVFDVGTSPEGYFFTMEYVRGVDARRLFGRIPREHALAIVAGAAAGLHHAHEHTDTQGRSLRIVHRDVSPSNLLVSYDGAVKVADFGVANAISEGNETRTRSLKGKISYMSPEQCRGRALDRRSDVFALGVVLYELTTGVRLFREASDFDTMLKIVKGDITPPRTLDPDYPVELEAIVQRALQRDPDQRFQTAQAMQLAIEQFIREHRLVVSSVSLGAFVSELIPPRGPSQPSATLGATDVASPAPAPESTIAPEPTATAAPTTTTPFTQKKSSRAGLAALAACVIAVAALGVGYAALARPKPSALVAALATPSFDRAHLVPPSEPESTVPAAAVPSDKTETAEVPAKPVPLRARRASRKTPAPRVEPPPPPALEATTPKPAAPASPAKAAPTAKPKPKWDLDSWHVP